VRTQAVSAAAARQTTGESSGRSTVCQKLHRQMNILLHKFKQACIKHKILELQILKTETGELLIPSVMAPFHVDG
jgi:hypothetical protein